MWVAAVVTFSLSWNTSGPGHKCLLHCGPHRTQEWCHNKTRVDRQCTTAMNLLIVSFAQSRMNKHAKQILIMEDVRVNYRDHVFMVIFQHVFSNHVGNIWSRSNMPVRHFGDAITSCIRISLKTFGSWRMVDVCSHVLQNSAVTNACCCRPAPCWFVVVKLFINWFYHHPSVLFASF